MRLSYSGYKEDNKNEYSRLWRKRLRVGHIEINRPDRDTGCTVIGRERLSEWTVAVVVFIRFDRRVYERAIQIIRLHEEKIIGKCTRESYTLKWSGFATHFSF